MSLMFQMFFQMVGRALVFPDGCLSFLGSPGLLHVGGRGISQTPCGEREERRAIFEHCNLNILPIKKQLSAVTQVRHL